MNPYQTRLIDSARTEIKNIEVLIQNGAYSAAISRAYYAMFHLAQALLDVKGLSFSKHSALISAFGKEFSKTGLIDTRLHNYLIQAQEDRLTADYDVMQILTEETARKHLERAIIFLDATISFLEKA